VTPEDRAAHVAEFIIAAAAPQAGRRWVQERRPTPLACRSQRPALRFFAEHRLFRIGEDVTRALLRWADGERDVVLLARVPAPREVLSWQAHGRRCVSLVGAEAPLGRHADPLAFALHDLCHLEKFVEPAHHVGQVGFFRFLHAAVASPAWAAFEAGFDDLWESERDYVLADMNGSPIFLLAALKMKLRMAVRRRLARQEGRPPVDTGPLSAREERAFEEAREQLFALFGWQADLAEAGRHVSTRRDAPEQAQRLLAAFEEEGRKPHHLG